MAQERPRGLFAQLLGELVGAFTGALEQGLAGADTAATGASDSLTRFFVGSADARARYDRGFGRALRSVRAGFAKANYWNNPEVQSAARLSFEEDERAPGDPTLLAEQHRAVTRGERNAQVLRAAEQRRAGAYDQAIELVKDDRMHVLRDAIDSVLAELYSRSDADQPHVQAIIATLIASDRAIAAAVTTYNLASTGSLTAETEPAALAHLVAVCQETYALTGAAARAVDRGPEALQRLAVAWNPVRGAGAPTPESSPVDEGVVEASPVYVEVTREDHATARTIERDLQAAIAADASAGVEPQPSGRSSEVAPAPLVNPKDLSADVTALAGQDVPPQAPAPESEPLALDEPAIGDVTDPLLEAPAVPETELLARLSTPDAEPAPLAGELDDEQLPAPAGLDDEPVENAPVFSGLDAEVVPDASVLGSDELELAPESAVAKRDEGLVSAQGDEGGGSSDVAGANSGVVYDEAGRVITAGGVAGAGALDGDSETARAESDERAELADERAQATIEAAETVNRVTADARRAQVAAPTDVVDESGEGSGEGGSDAALAPSAPVALRPSLVSSPTGDDAEVPVSRQDPAETSAVDDSAELDALLADVRREEVLAAAARARAAERETASTSDSASREPQSTQASSSAASTSAVDSSSPSAAEQSALAASLASGPSALVPHPADTAASNAPQDPAAPGLASEALAAGAPAGAAAAESSPAAGLGGETPPLDASLDTTADESVPAGAPRLEGALAPDAEILGAPAQGSSLAPGASEEPPAFEASSVAPQDAQVAGAGALSPEAPAGTDGPLAAAAAPAGTATDASQDATSGTSDPTAEAPRTGAPQSAPAISDVAAHRRRVIEAVDAGHDVVRAHLGPQEAADTAEDSKAEHRRAEAAQLTAGLLGDLLRHDATLPVLGHAKAKPVLAAKGPGQLDDSLLSLVVDQLADGATQARTRAKKAGDLQGLGHAKSAQKRIEALRTLLDSRKHADRAQARAIVATLLLAAQAYEAQLAATTEPWPAQHNPVAETSQTVAPQVAPPQLAAVPAGAPTLGRRHHSIGAGV